MERLRRVLRGADPSLPIGEAMHPVVLAAVVVLVVNDWVLKARFPGVVTGKLSDVAGLVFAPCVLSAAIGLVMHVARRDGRLTLARAVACTAATGAVFAAVKLCPACGDALASAIGALGRRAHFAPDRTDLLALPALGVAGWVFRAELRSLSAPTAARRGDP